MASSGRVKKAEKVKKEAKVREARKARKGNRKMMKKHENDEKIKMYKYLELKYFIQKYFKQKYFEPKNPSYNTSKKGSLDQNF